MKILLIEDEPSVSAFIKKGLEENGYEVSQAFDGQMGLSLARQFTFDLVILDLILPQLNGLEVCKKLRQEGYENVPILMLTALGTTDDVVQGLDAGADDYLVKPFKFQELLARLRALSRRNKGGPPDSNRLSIANLVMDLDQKTVTRSGTEIPIT